MLKLVYGKHFIVDVLSPSTEEVNSFSFFFFFYLHLAYQVHDGPPTDMCIGTQVEPLERKIDAYTRLLTSVGWCIKKSYIVKPSKVSLYTIYFL